MTPSKTTPSEPIGLLLIKGQVVNRRMGRDGPIMKMTILGLTDVVVYCTAGERKPDEPMKEFTISELEDYYQRGMIWKFDRTTGMEEDPELGWGVSFGITGTYLERN